MRLAPVTTACASSVAGRPPRLARDFGARKQALELARNTRLPNVSLGFSITGTVSQTLSAMLVLSTRREVIRAGIEQAQADLRAA